MKLLFIKTSDFPSLATWEQAIKTKGESRIFNIAINWECTMMKGNYQHATEPNQVHASSAGIVSKA